MTTLSFRVDDTLVEALQAEVARGHRSRSELLAEALRHYLYRLACERDAAILDARAVGDDEGRDDAALWTNESWLVDEPGTDWAEVFGG
jgi:predicted transcriptional regulator